MTAESEPISVYQYGWVRGCADARHVLDLDSRGYSEAMRYVPEGMPDPALLPMTVAERADWLNGYAAGIRHIALNRHTHADDGTVEGCPGCFPGPDANDWAAPGMTGGG